MNKTVRSTISSPEEAGALMPVYRGLEGWPSNQIEQGFLLNLDNYPFTVEIPKRRLRLTLCMLHEEQRLAESKLLELEDDCCYLAADLFGVAVILLQNKERELNGQPSFLD